MSGQDRESYTDTQDRDSYTVSHEKSCRCEDCESTKTVNEYDRMKQEEFEEAGK